MHVLISIHLKTQLGTVWGSLEVSVLQSPLWSSALWTWAALALLVSCLCLQNWDCSPCLCSFSLCHGLEFFNKLKIPFRAYVVFLQGHSLSLPDSHSMSCKPCFIYFVLVCFRQECKSKSLLTSSWPQVVVRVWALLASFWKRLLPCSGNPKLLSLITVNSSGKRISFSIYTVHLRMPQDWSWLSHVFTSGLILWPGKWCILIGQSPGSYASPQSFLRGSTSPSLALAVWSRHMVAPKGGDARQTNIREFLYMW